MTVELTTCECEELHQPGGFNGWKDYHSLIAEVSKTPFLAEVEVAKPYSNVGLAENWYACAKCGTKWRLVEPDPPFGGLWQHVTD